MAITLLEMLLDAGLINPGQCDEALQNRVFFGGRIGTNLIDLGFITEEDLARFLSRKLAVPYVDPKDLLNIPPEVIALIPGDLALQYQVVPVRLEHRRLHVATADPTALTAIDEISFITGKIVKPMITPEVRLVQSLGKYYRYAIDDRYRQIIDRIEEQRKAAEAFPKPPADEDSQALPQEKRSENIPADSTNAEEQHHEPWKRQIERYSIDQTSRSLAHAEDPGEIGDILIRFLGQEFGRAALFLIRAGAVCGWRAVRDGVLREEFRKVRLALTDAAGLDAVAEKQKTYHAPLPASPLRTLLVETLGEEGGEEVLMVPVPLGGRTVAILYAEGTREKLQRGKGLLTRLAGKASLAFEILIAREKILIS